MLPSLDSRLIANSLLHTMQLSRQERYTLRGNHDAVSVVTQSVRLPDGVFEFPSKSADTVLLDDIKVAIHGRSFSNRAVPENFATSYQSQRRGEQHAMPYRTVPVRCPEHNNGVGDQ